MMEDEKDMFSEDMAMRDNAVFVTGQKASGRERRNKCWVIEIFQYQKT